MTANGGQNAAALSDSDSSHMSSSVGGERSKGKGRGGGGGSGSDSCCHDSLEDEEQPHQQLQEKI